VQRRRECQDAHPSGAGDRFRPLAAAPTF
jgi:hypothetical protein